MNRAARLAAARLAAARHGPADALPDLLILAKLEPDGWEIEAYDPVTGHSMRRAQLDPGSGAGLLLTDIAADTNRPAEYPGVAR